MSKVRRRRLSLPAGSPATRYNRRVETSAPATPETAADNEREGRFSRRQRFFIWLIGWAEFLLIRLLGPTLRFSISIEEGGPSHWHMAGAIYPFWHRCVIPGTFLARGKQMTVLLSSSFDGECSVRPLAKFGFRTARGSSTRGGARGLLGMQKAVESGYAVVFTIDGPRGPMYVAKLGPVLLARITGSPIICFHIALENAWVLSRSWDKLMIPKPFSRALVRISRMIYVPRDTQDLDPYRGEMQAALDRVREYAEANVARAEQVGRPFESFDSHSLRQ